jgi:hypothetical protein
LNTNKQNFEKPSNKELEQVLGESISTENASLLLEQIEELCLIIIEQHANG